MKRKLQLILSASASSVLALSALGQVTTTPQPAHADYGRYGLTNSMRMDRLNGAAKASDLIGMTVKNYQDVTLGKVDELAVDMESGRVVQVILTTGGFLGIGETLTAVPPGALHHDTTNKVLHLDADKDKLKAAPKFEASNWAESSDSNRLATVYGYYGQETAFHFVHSDGQNVPDDQNNTSYQRDNEGRLKADRLGMTNRQHLTGTRTNSEARDAARYQNHDGSPKDIAATKADGTWGMKRSSMGGYTVIPVSRLSQIQKASKVMGTPVKNMQSETLGKVENLLVDVSSGRIVAVVVSSGGFLGMNDELSAVPPTALRFNTERDALQLDASKEKLAAMPHFKANQWPDFAQPGYSDSVYRSYKVEPYFTTNVTSEPDNTARNVRDRESTSLTPLDHGSSQADIDTTAKIRKEIVGNSNMSVNAQNVKIITNQGRVTLRGPVNSADEKRLIGEIANRIASAVNVDNQLEVKLTASSN